LRTLDNKIFAQLGRWNGRYSTIRFATVTIAIAVALLAARAEAGPKSSAKPGTADNPGGDAKHGQQLYTSSGCYQCHGREGQGSRYSGARIGPPPISLSGFTDYIRQPAGQMPPYTRKVLSDAEVADIYAFLKSVPQPPPAKSIPLLSD
jgi:ubiquinol-cytochrome c reductase cytochrome c subunit